MASLLVDYGDSGSSSENEEDSTLVQNKNRKPGSSFNFNDTLEEDVKPKASQISSATKPSKKGIVKIAATVAPDLHDSDSDDDNNSTVTKTKSTSKKCGLFGLLPPPTALTRNLVPHSVARKRPLPASTKPAPPKSVLAAKAKRQQTSEETAHTTGVTLELPTSARDSDEDEDDDDSDVSQNFFGDFKKNDFSALKTQPLETRNSDVTHVANSRHLSSEKKIPSTSVSANFSETENLVESRKPQVGLQNRDFLTMKPAAAGSNVQSSSQYPERSPSTSKTTSSVTENTQGGDFPSTSSAVNRPIEGVPASVEQGISETELMRLAGKHERKRGLDKIEIFDIHGDDRIDRQEFMKNLSVEVSHSSKKNAGPGGIQKRKHQITYLAFQAKERELELKNEWAKNRRTKRETQWKYGF